MCVFMTQLHREIHQHHLTSSHIIIIIMIIIIIVLIPTIVNVVIMTILLIAIITMIIIIIIFKIITISSSSIVQIVYKTCQTPLITCIMYGHFNISEYQMETLARAAALLFWIHELQLPNRSKQKHISNPMFSAWEDIAFYFGPRYFVGDDI